MTTSPSTARPPAIPAGRLWTRTRRKLTFWTLLAAAVLALSQFLAAWRLWRAVPSLDHAAAVAAFGVILVGAMGWLGFLLYEVDRAAGRIRHPVGVYEWIIARRRPDAAPGRPDAPRERAEAGR